MSNRLTSLFFGALLALGAAYVPQYQPINAASDSTLAAGFGFSVRGGGHGGRGAYVGRGAHFGRGPYSGRGYYGPRVYNRGYYNAYPGYSYPYYYNQGYYSTPPYYYNNYYYQY